VEKKTHHVRTFPDKAHEVLLALERLEIVGKRAYGAA
jgi:hypothetical protein